MDEHSTSSLKYGHLGTPTYEAEDRRWNFMRKPNPCPFQLSGAQPVALKSSSIACDGSNSLGDGFSLQRDNGQRSTGGNRGSVGGSLRPRMGEMIAFGYAADSRSRTGSGRSIPIVAHIAGYGASAVRLTPIRAVDLDLMREVNASVKIPSVDVEEGGWWVGSGVPIQQLTFAEPYDSNGFMLAIRTPSAIAILKPQYHLDPVPATLMDKGVNRSIYPSSQVHANHVATLTVQTARSSAFADIRFNPWYQKQFAVVDEFGAWSVWNMEGRSRTKLLAGPSGHLNGIRGESKRTRSEGLTWAAVCWVGVFDQLLICDRYKAKLLRITDPNNSHDLDLKLDVGGEVILRLKRSPGHSSHFLILTNIRLIWAQIKTEGHVSDEPFRVLAAWSHFRNATDSSLAIDTVLCGNVIHAMLHSRQDSIIQGFPLACALGQDTLRASLQDPYCFPTERGLGSLRAHVADFHLREIGYHCPPGSPDLNFGLYKSFGLQQDLTLVETLYYCWDCPRTRQQTGTQQAIPCPARSYKRRGIAGTASSSGRSFVLDCIADDDSSARMLQQRKFHEICITSRHSAQPLRSDARDVNLQAVYRYCSGQGKPLSFGLDENPFPRYCSRLFRQISSRTLMSFSYMLTMIDLRKSRPSIPDIEHSSAEFAKAFCASTAYHQDFPMSKALYQISRSSVPLSLAVTYDELLRTWVGTLPLSILSSVRSSKERENLRRLALDLCMARLCVSKMQHSRSGDLGEAKRNHLNTGSELSAYPEFVDASWTSPDPRSSSPPIARSSPLNSKSEKHAQSEGLADELSEPILTPDSHISPSCPSNGIASRDAYLSLHKYMKADLPHARIKHELFRATRDLLSHWDIGCNPTSYDYNGKEVVLEEEQADDRDERRQAREKRSRRAAKQAAKRVQKSDRIEGDTQAHPAFSSQLQSKLANSSNVSVIESVHRSITDRSQSVVSSTSKPNSSGLASSRAHLSQVPSQLVGLSQLSRTLQYPKKARKRRSGF